MTTFVPWNSKPLEQWASQHARGKFVDLDGRKTHYIEKGQGDPLILIHGFNFDSHTWVSNIDALAGRFKVYALDLWGFGFSTRQPLEYGYRLFAEQVRLFMDMLDIERASLIGHSMGGGTAIVFSLHNRHRVDKLVLVDAAGMPIRLPIRSKLFQLPLVAEFLLGLNTNAIRRKNLSDYWIHNQELLTDSYFEKAVGFQKIEGSTETLLNILRRDFFGTLEEEIGQLGQTDVPILIVWGQNEALIPLQCGQEMHRLLRGSRLEIIENAGHLSNFDRPELFNKLALDFLTGEADQAG